MYQAVRPWPVPYAREVFLQNLCHLVKMFFQGERSELRLMNSVEYVTGVSPYQLPVINPCVVPVPPPRLHRGDRRVAAVRGGGPTGRRFRPTTAFNEQFLINVSSLCLCTGVLPSSLVCLLNAERCAYLVCIKKMCNY